MAEVNLDTPVGEIAATQPQTVRILEKYRLDYCCHGENTLGAACEAAGVDAEQVLGETRQAAASAGADNETDWLDRSLTELCNHIEATHHAFLREQLPHLTELLDKVVAVHGANHPELHELRGTFSELRAELEPHMMKEEQILFPAVVALEDAGQALVFPFGSVRNPIGVMEDEHDVAGRALQRIRVLTDDLTPPADACNSYRALYDGLAQLEADLHTHIHKENNILFPRAQQLEGSGAPATS